MPGGYRRHTSGLIIPQSVSRVREVWTKTEWMTVEKAIDLLAHRGIKFQFACAHPDCKEAGGAMEKRTTDNGEAVLRCAHKDRLLSRLK